MALIECPGCKLPVSSLQETCPRCGVSPNDPPGTKKPRKGFDRNVHYILSISLFAVGCYLYYRSTVVLRETSVVAAVAMTGGVFWYVLARFWPR